MAASRGRRVARRAGAATASVAAGGTDTAARGGRSLLTPSRGSRAAGVLLALLETTGVVEAGGDGTFRGVVQILGVAPPDWIACGDFDGDGKLSLATVSGVNEVDILDRDPGQADRWKVTAIAPPSPTSTATGRSTWSRVAPRGCRSSSA